MTDAPGWYLAGKWHRSHEGAMTLCGITVGLASRASMAEVLADVQKHRTTVCGGCERKVGPADSRAGDENVLAPDNRHAEARQRIKQEKKRRAR